VDNNKLNPSRNGHHYSCWLATRQGAATDGTVSSYLESVFDGRTPVHKMGSSPLRKSEAVNLAKTFDQHGSWAPELHPLSSLAPLQPTY
jgi:hypothetical protein